MSCFSSISFPVFTIVILQEEDEKIDHSNLEVDYDYFYNHIWPILVKRVPAFRNLKVSFVELSTVFMLVSSGKILRVLMNRFIPRL